MKYTKQNQPKHRNAWLLSLLLTAALLLSACGSMPNSSVSRETPAPDSPVLETAQPDGPSDPDAEQPDAPADPDAEQSDGLPDPDAGQSDGLPDPDAGQSDGLPAVGEYSDNVPAEGESSPSVPDLSEVPFVLADAAPYSSEAYTVVNDNQPYFSEADLTAESYEVYSPLDSLGRCGPAYASIGRDLMPTAERESIGQVKPTGWHTVKYSGIDGNYLYNRCHLIGYQLSGENANEENLITGTRYLNVQGMLPFENMVADYVKETGNHVLYRVTPIFEGNNLLASGVLMEAESVEDKGADILFCVYVYNVQPGIAIDYATGNSEPAANTAPTAEDTQAPPKETVSQEEETSPQAPQGSTFILNTNTKKFHIPTCSSVKQMKDSNKQEYTGNREDVISMGYDPCKRCYP